MSAIMQTTTSGVANKNGGTPEGARQGNQLMLNMPEWPRHSKANGSTKPVDATPRIDDLIKKPPSDAEKWHITPKIAESMLAWNDRNRPMSDATVKKYATLMREGRWHYTGEAIIFSKQRLIDGQHRLAAIIESGSAIDALVVFGAPDEAFAFIDVGKTRSASNIFAIHGVKNHAIMAASIVIVMGYEEDTAASAFKGTMRIDHAALYEYYLKHQGLQDSAWVAHLFAPARLVPPSIMCAMHYLCAKKSKSEADAFFRKVGEGIGFSGKRDPAYKLHKVFVEAAVNQQRHGRKSVAALTVKAWNATRLGRDVGALNFSADETFPKVI